ncbi:hypothetical protein WDU94_014704 [Cyamophila willieti]
MNIIQTSHARALLILRVIFVLSAITLSFSIIETYFPVSKEEIELLRYIYKRSRPERRLQTNFWIPFLDDSESPTYEIIFYVEFYLILMLSRFYSPIMLCKVILSNLLFALCLYQLTASSSQSMSKVRFYKLVLEFISVFVTYYYLCHSSERLDDWQSRVNRAITKSHWYTCSKNTRRDVCMFLRRTQGPNHLNFYGKALVLGRAYFMSVVKVSYSFVNYMRLNTSKYVISYALRQI